MIYCVPIGKCVQLDTLCEVFGGGARERATAYTNQCGMFLFLFLTGYQMTSEQAAKHQSH